MRIVALVLAAVMAVGCVAPTGSLFATTLQVEGRAPFPVTLRDEAALVTGLEALPAGTGTWDFGAPALRADPANPAVLVLTWAGGTCMENAELTLRAASPGYTLHLGGRGSSGNCTAAAVERGVRILTSEPVDPASVTLSGGG